MVTITWISSSRLTWTHEKERWKQTTLLREHRGGWLPCGSNAVCVCLSSSLSLFLQRTDRLGGRVMDNFYGPFCGNRRRPDHFARSFGQTKEVRWRKAQLIYIREWAMKLQPVSVHLTFYQFIRPIAQWQSHMQDRGWNPWSVVILVPYEPNLTWYISVCDPTLQEPVSAQGEWFIYENELWKCTSSVHLTYYHNSLLCRSGLSTCRKMDGGRSVEPTIFSIVTDGWHDSRNIQSKPWNLANTRVQCGIAL
jgi:hypothetical protein